MRGYTSLFDYDAGRLPVQVTRSYVVCDGDRRRSALWREWLPIDLGSIPGPLYMMTPLGSVEFMNRKLLAHWEVPCRDWIHRDDRSHVLDC
ncbi:MAG TPA: hypothetical protein VER03_19080 [Bryobacteraceae bacterium]|nr:hypothetical protein [Bryobacteraceae bacterium]